MCGCVCECVCVGIIAVCDDSGVSVCVPMVCTVYTSLDARECCV